MSTEFDKYISDYTDYKNDLDFFFRLVKRPKIAVKKAKIFRNFRNKSRSILMLHKISKNKKCAPRLIFFYKIFFYKDSDDFWHWKLTLKIRFWHFLTAIFGHLTSLMKKSIPYSWSVQSWLQSEMFLSNSVDPMKYLSQVILIWLYCSRVICHSPSMRAYACQCLCLECTKLNKTGPRKL